MKRDGLDTGKRVYHLTMLPDGCPAIVLHRPHAEDAGAEQIVATFRNTETGHELAEEICELKNSDFPPYFHEHIEA